MIRLSLRAKSGLYVIGFTLFFIVTLMIAIGVGFNNFFYSVKKDGMIEASQEISAIYKEKKMDGESQFDLISQNLGAEILIIDNSQLVYSSRPGRRIFIGPPKADTKDVVVAVGKEEEAKAHQDQAEQPKHIQEMIDLLQGRQPDEDELGKVKHYRPSETFQYFNLISRIEGQSYVLISQPVAPMKKTISIVQHFIFTCGIIWLVIAVIGTILLTNKMVKPLLELKKISVAMTHMNFTQKWQGRNTDEIGELGRSLNTLSDQLHHALDELQKSNDKLKQQLDKAKEIEHMRKSFIFAVSHELKTPLAIIQGYAEGLDSLQSDEQTRRRYCHVIQTETVKMDNLVKSLLNLSRLETGAFKLEKMIFDFGALTDEAQARFAQAVQKKEIRITWKLPPDMTTYGDPEQIDCIMSNFLSNAIDYTPQGKEITVTGEDLGTVYKVFIHNQGIQIPEACQKRIWEPFYKVDTARSRNVQRTFGGHGLGLGIVAELVKLHGQTYGVYNTDDGVTFWFTVEKAKS